MTQLPFSQVPERALLHAQLLLHAFLAAAGQLAGAGSSAIFFLSAVSTFGALFVDRVTSYLSTPIVGDAATTSGAGKMRDGDANGLKDGNNKVEDKNGFVSLWTYALGQVIPLLTGTQLLAATLVVFVPLVSDLLYVTISSITPLVLPHRLVASVLRRQQNISLLLLSRSWDLTHLVSLHPSFIGLVRPLCVKQ